MTTLDLDDKRLELGPGDRVRVTLCQVEWELDVSCLFMAGREVLVLDLPDNTYLGSNGQLYICSFGPGVSELRYGKLVLERAHSLIAITEESDGDGV